ncbi:hypothetical protein MA16_Dca027187 [Dendrobium catenatum]|uniref:Uncharacterized protein n=1 Tax=Dendrobium catenatum TaxID=906689 RepID=A0A2I0VEX0_9ASPA|nr:hypothetical protein MA16_Dca027187 [Dendrobium catenatum]
MSANLFVQLPWNTRGAHSGWLRVKSLTPIEVAALADKRTIEAKFPKLDSPEHLSLENHARMESMLAFGIGDGGENVSIRNSVNNSQVC